MKETLVSFTVAKLAKEKGFDIPTNTLYQINGSLHTVIPSDKYPHLKIYRDKEIDSYTDGFLNWNNININEDERIDKYSGFNEMAEDSFSVSCSAPTQFLLQRWLREKHNIIVIVFPIDESIFTFDDQEVTQILWENEIIDVKDDWNTFSDYSFYHSYEEALEGGLFEALKLIKI